MSEQPQEQEFHHGRITGVIAKPGGKWQVEVDTGGQHVRRFWTKDKELKDGLEARIGEEDGFLCDVSHWTNSEGKPVRSLWIHEVGGEAPVAATGAPVSASAPQGGRQGQPEFQRDLSPEAQARIERHQLREMKARAWEVTALTFTAAREVPEGTTEQSQLWGKMKFFQALVLSDIAGDLQTQQESDDAPF